MFGTNADSAKVGITGMAEFVELDGPNMIVRLKGRFWHERTRVVERIKVYVLERIPECLDVVIEDAAQLDDSEKDELTKHRLAWRGVGVGRHAPAVFSRCMPPVAAAPEAGAPASADEPVNVGDSQTTIANSGAAPAAAPSDAAAAPASDDDTLVQFVVVRRDLLKTMEWPVGSVIAQACHACLAVAWENKDDPDVASYLAAENINSMHKVTKEVKGEAQLLTLADKLRGEGVVFKLWQEQPENIPTAIALKPYPASRVKPLLKKYSLFR